MYVYGTVRHHLTNLAAKAQSKTVSSRSVAIASQPPRTRAYAITRLRRPFLGVLLITCFSLGRHFSVWGSTQTMRSQDQLVDLLVASGVVKHKDVDRVLRAVDRAFFCGGDNTPKHYIYQDSPLPIGYGETISAPHMHATCLEILRTHLRPGARVLDVGSGSGYLSAAMALMVAPGGKVIGIEKHPELADQSRQNIRAAMPDMLDAGTLEIRAGNVLGDALASEDVGFDAIHVGAAADTLPEILVNKLRHGGRMVIPVGPQWDYQVMQVIDKDIGGNITKKNLMGVRYVPLTRPGEE